MKDLIKIKTFLSRPEAEIAKGLLAEQGIVAVISIDDAAGQLPDLAFLSGGVQLLVNKNDLDRAKAILEQS